MAKPNYKRAATVLGLSLILLALGAFAARQSKPVDALPAPGSGSTTSLTGFLPRAVSSIADKIMPPAGERIVIASVPFTSQAPFGDWADPREQNGCEEAASLMAVSWARGQTFTSQQALDQILGASAYELKNYGEFNDASAADTLSRIIEGYFNYQKAELINDITVAGLIDQLRQGRLLIVPVNGQVIGNPYYTAPGPATHMIVITGYDAGKNIFITNDPGTRRGKNYPYDTGVFYNAMRDYPTGDHLPITAIQKNAIAVWR